MADLITFLAARLDEDKALIGRNSDGHGLDDGFPDYRTYVDGDTKAADAYIEHFGPVRMLREVAAKRALLKLADDAYYEADHYAYHGIRRILAAIWSDAPDYREEWKP